MQPQGNNIVRAAKHPYGTYGDGNQGAVVYDGSTTILGVVPASNVYQLTADIEVTNMTVNAGITIKCAGFVPRVQGRLWNKGTITSLQNDAVGGTQGAAIAAAGSLATAGAAGGAGVSSTGAGNNGTGSGSNNISGSASGAGGTAGGANTGGTGNNTVAPTAARGKWRNLQYVNRGKLNDGTAGNGSGGGGSGGCNIGAGTATSGGGGSGAIPLHIFCRYLQNDGTIHTKGGAGGNAVATGNGKAGGGGGGASAPIHIVTDAVITLGSVLPNGGLAGTGIGGGADGNPGTNSYYMIFTPTRVLNG